MIKLQSRDIRAMMEGTLAVPDGRNDPGMTPDEIHWAYNALDSAVTFRVHNALAPLLAKSPHAATSYAFVRAMQGPALAMMNRGIAINQKVRQDETVRYEQIKAQAQATLDVLADAVWGPERFEIKERRTEVYQPVGKRGQLLTERTRSTVVSTWAVRPRGLNPASPKQVLAFFNTALGFPVEYEIRKTPNGTIRTPTANDKALKKWAERRTKGPGVPIRDRTVAPVCLGAPFVFLILTIRDADKMLSVLRTPLDADGRMRCSYNVVGTENGRWSSSSNVYGRGTNLQNITPSMRRMFCADDGYWFVSTDLEQAESRLVAGLVWEATGDRTYWDACLSGDLHTQVCRMAWPELEWTNDPKFDRAMAERPYVGLEPLSYRDVAKRIGHGSNYRGSPFGIAQAVGIPARIVEDFQGRYYRAFPAILDWHSWVRTQLLTHQYLDTPLGRRRWFFGRPEDDSTLREAIACVPQSTVGELLNLVMYKVWARSNLPFNHADHLPIQLLLQNHDAFAFQTSTKLHLPAVIAAVNHEFNSTPIPLVRGNQHEALVIPGEFVTGFNWAYADKGPNQDTWTFKDGNPDGLRKWTGSDARSRQQGAKVASYEWIA